MCHALDVRIYNKFPRGFFDKRAKIIVFSITPRGASLDSASFWFTQAILCRTPHPGVAVDSFFGAQCANTFLESVKFSKNQIFQKPNFPIFLLLDKFQKTPPFQTCAWSQCSAQLGAWLKFRRVITNTRVTATHGAGERPRVYFGKSSPPLLQGLQRKIRQKAFRLPQITPCFLITAWPYSEHVGVKRQ